MFLLPLFYGQPFVFHPFTMYQIHVCVAYNLAFEGRETTKILMSVLDRNLLKSGKSKSDESVSSRASKTQSSGLCGRVYGTWPGLRRVVEFMAGGRVQGGVVGFKADTRPANRGIVLEYIAPLVTGNNVLATRSGHQYTRCKISPSLGCPY
jgi:hypothetical protein